MAKYDLTKTISRYLDRHLVVPLLEYLSVKSIYDGDSILRSKLDLLMETSMVDFTCLTYKLLHNVDDVPEELIKKRQDTLDLIRVMEEKMAPIDKIFSTETMKEMVQCKVAKELFQNLEAKYGFKPDMLDDMFEAARVCSPLLVLLHHLFVCVHSWRFDSFELTFSWQTWYVFYDSGLYDTASDYLRIIRQLVSSTDKRHLHACWGRLAAEILVQNWDEALDDVEKLKDAIDCQSDDRLQQRTWLLHWSLFVFFNHVQGKEKLIDFFLNNPNHLNAIQTLTPHLLRYLAVCVVVSNDKRKKNQLREVVHLIQQESYCYKDPITEFLECLYVKFDFDGAQQQLKICETVIPNDFFLTGCYEDFMENGRLLMFETFCRIHNCVGIKMLAEKLNMNVDDAESWIVNLIRNAEMDAKIDSKKGLVFMGTHTVSPYQQVVEKTINGAFTAHKLLDRLKSSKLDAEAWNATSRA
ncbi:Eukaryotic translation initiation factor 3 subunit E [Echinococcus granulosus]|uniref:Eukaryotic translation initiation factor 3 subunit E n=1 Tax=Echinococcus granulosus TaxID=6210 RepID=W6V758_ECHGR|nr:Eukaryotic translation initiation factor 3 subunit E [Echinococcus granulosus]EUB62274.1 Eukaryotic translation initiation factor 3 subunit E [Echinococcus granulosus]